jgi:hypothetical protein
LEEDEKSMLSCPEDVEIRDDMETNNNVKTFVDKIVNDLAEAKDIELNGTKVV